MEKLNYAQKKCLSQTGLLMQQTGQIREGARVGVAVSGGVDSLSMLKILTLRQRINPFDFELMVLHVNPGFDKDAHLPLVEHVKQYGLASHFENTTIGLDAHSEKNRKRSACFYCSWFRRKKLFDLCKKYNLTHLALGHTNEDLVATFFMNLVQTGKVAGLGSRNSYFDGKLTLIRPLLLCDKKVLIRAAKKWGLPVQDNPCPSAGLTRRQEILEMVEEKWGDDKLAKRNIFNGLARWQLDLDRIMQ